MRIGIPWVARKMMTTTSPTIEISQNGDSWTIKTSSLMSSSHSTFKLSEEYEETMMGGRSIKVCFHNSTKLNLQTHK